MAPMFPPRARKCASSLYSCSKKVSNRMLVKFITSPMSVRKVRKYIRQSLPAVILTDMLSSLVPSPSDKWRFPCAVTQDRLHCRMHPECELVYARLDRIIRVMFSEDISHVNINLN